MSDAYVWVAREPATRNIHRVLTLV
jgi:hypothetical protein